MAYADPLDERARASRRKHYENNRGQYVDRNRQAKEEKRQFVRSLKEATPCGDCGGRFPHYVMEFDHTSDDKLSNIANLISRSWATLNTEIAKCEIVCSNCHAARTWHRAHPPLDSSSGPL